MGYPYCGCGYSAGIGGVSLWLNIFGLSRFDPAKFGINISENTKLPNEDNKTYLTRLMKNAICRLILKTFYVNSDTQLIGKITSIEF